MPHIVDVATTEGLAVGRVGPVASVEMALPGVKELPFRHCSR